MAKLTLSQSPKFKLLVRTLGIPIAHVRGHLEMLWEAAHWRDNPYYSSFDEIEASAEWCGEDNALGQALLDRHWIDQTDDGYVLHDYEDHIPSYVKDRRRKADYRKAIQRKSIDCPQTVTGQSHQEKRKEEKGMKEKGMKEKGTNKQATNKQATLTEPLPENQEDQIVRFNSMCSLFSRMVIPVTDKDRQAMRRILSDCKPDGERFTIDDVENIGGYLKKNALSESATFKWIPEHILSFKDLVSIGSKKVPFYQSIYRSTLRKA